MRRLIEQSSLTYAEIEARTGVGRASICRWTRDGDWQRPVFAPRATDTVPRARASAKLRRRMLAARLSALAERHVRELEAAATIEPEKLAAALELLKMAKLAARPKKRWRGEKALRPESGEDPAQVIARLRAAGVDLVRAPPAALGDFIASHAAVRDEPSLREKGRRSKRNRDHARMMERE
ncbi:MAG: hypothetical protein ACXWKC_09840 [Xanthobacteraceae bacterium]